MGGLVFFLLIIFGVIQPLLGLSDSWSQELARKGRMLQQYQQLSEGRGKVAQAYQEVRDALAQAEMLLLSGTNSTMGAAELQDILKGLTGTHGLKVNSMNVLPPRESGPFLEIPIQVHCSGTIEQLSNVLYQLEHHQKLLFLPYLEIRGGRRTDPQATDSLLQLNMEVAGIIKKGS